MKISSITAEAYSIPVKAPPLTRGFHHPFVLVRIETDDGFVGHGPSGGGGMSAAMAFFIKRMVAPVLTGENPLNHERIWQMLYARFNQRGLTGFWSSVASAIDIALWDIKGKHARLPIATLLGGAHAARPTYVTFGVAEYSQDQLIEAAGTLIAAGHRRLKMVVGGVRQQAAGEAGTAGPPGVTGESLREDARRVHALRDAVGPDVELMIDANCELSVAQALELAAMVDDCNLSWFEEPVTANHPSALAQVRARTRIPIAAGQFIGHAWEHAALVEAGAVDVVQPGVTTVGGFTEALRVAAMARACGVSISNGGGYAQHNLHLHAGVPNGGHLEHHGLIMQAVERVFVGLPETQDGWMSVPAGPGLGFEPRPAEELAEFRLES